MTESERDEDTGAVFAGGAVHEHRVVVVSRDDHPDRVDQLLAIVEAERDWNGGAARQRLDAQVHFAKLAGAAGLYVALGPRQAATPATSRQALMICTHVVPFMPPIST